MRRSNRWVSVSPLTFALGREALSRPFTVKEVARVTGGRFTPLPVPGDIITVLPGIKVKSGPISVTAGEMVAESPPPKEELSEEITVPLNNKDPRFKKYLDAVRDRVLQTWRYPDGAEEGLHGVLELEIFVGRDGSVSQVQVIKSSGYPILDEGAKEAVRRASPFPPIPPTFKTKRLKIRAGFRYN